MTPTEKSAKKTITRMDRLTGELIGSFQRFVTREEEEEKKSAAQKLRIYASERRRWEFS